MNNEILQTKLESEVSTAERNNQLGQGLKILTLDQMLSRFQLL